MADDLTKKDIEKLLQAQTSAILNAVNERFMNADKRFENLLGYMDKRFSQVEVQIEANREAIRELANTLDAFLKKLTDYETKMEVFRKKMDKIIVFIKEKFGVEITAQ